MKLILIVYAITFIPSFLLCRYFEKKEWCTKDYLWTFIKTWFWSPIAIPHCIYKTYKSYKDESKNN